jgi:hypothetical protein
VPRQVEDEGTAVVEGPDNCIYLAGGGYEYDFDSMRRSVSLWRPNPPGTTGGKWHALAPLPTRVSDATGCVVAMADGEKVLALVGGTHIESDGSDAEKDEKVIVLRNGNWQALTSCPIGLMHARYRRYYKTVALPNGRLAVVGAGATNREVHVLDIEADTWSKLPNLTVARQNPLLAVRGQTLFVLGGLDPGNGDRLYSCEKYMLEEDAYEGSWCQCVAMPIGAGTSSQSAYQHARARAYIVRDSLLVATQEGPGEDGILLRLYDFGMQRWYGKRTTLNYGSSIPPHALGWSLPPNKVSSDGIDNDTDNDTDNSDDEWPL